MVSIKELLFIPANGESPVDKLQPHRFQQDAVETARLFDDLKSLGIYLRIFKKYSLRREGLLTCRAWVKAHAKSPGRMFVAVYKKFV